MTPAEIRLVWETTQRINAILAGIPPEQQGAILADLAATWISAHHGDTDTDTDEFHATLISLWLEAVMKITVLKRKEMAAAMAEPQQ